MIRHLGLMVLIGPAVIYGQQSTPDSHSMHEQHMKEGTMADHHSGVNGRGDQAMGFSHEKTITTSCFAVMAG